MIVRDTLHIIHITFDALVTIAQGLAITVEEVDIPREMCIRDRLAATATLPAHAQLKTNAGVQYLLSQPKDMSQDFLAFSNTYFFADRCV